MNSRQASGPGMRWREALWGSRAGLGARVLLGGGRKCLAAAGPHGRERPGYFQEGSSHTA